MSNTCRGRKKKKIASVENDTSYGRTRRRGIKGISAVGNLKLSDASTVIPLCNHAIAAAMSTYGTDTNLGLSASPRSNWSQ